MNEVMNQIKSRTVRKIQSNRKLIILKNIHFATLFIYALFNVIVSDNIIIKVLFLQRLEIDSKFLFLYFLCKSLCS